MIESREVSLSEVVDPSSQVVEAAKQSLRNEIRLRITALDAPTRHAADSKIRGILESWLSDHASGVVCGYLPLRDEPDLQPLLGGLLDRGVRIAVPEVVSGHAPELRVLEVDRSSAFRETRPSSLGTRVPVGVRVVDPSEVTVVLVPGVAFDASGGRLGRGGGYFDSFLQTLGKGAIAIGIAYDTQMVPIVPRAAHDLAVDWLCTERGIVRAG